MQVTIEPSAQLRQEHMASVIILTKNPGEVFRKVLAAVLAQKTSFPFEVLVVDSGSTDGTVEYVNAQRDSRLRTHRIDPKEFGHGRTRNLGISRTNGKYAVMITHDACPATHDWLECLVITAEQDDRIAGVFGRHIAYPNANPFVARELEIHFSGFEKQSIVSLDDADRYAKDIGYRQFLHFFSDNNALIRRSVWEQLPYPDVDFAEDQIWAQRVIECGWRKAYAAKAAVFHSHEYGLWERLQRSFDESRAFLRYFGYRLCPNIRSLSRSWGALTRRDWRFALSSNLWRQRSGLVLWMAIDNLMRLAGHYLGATSERLPGGIVSFLSRDHLVLTGRLKL